MMERKAAYLQITRKCNNECIFCSNPQFENDLTFEQSKDEIADLKNEKVTEVILTGGEPTLVDFLPELIEYILSGGLSVKMITNGVNLSDKHLTQKLYDAGLRTIHVSVHSVKKEIADRLCQRAGHFIKAILGIRNALDAGFNVSINSTINALNCDHLSLNVEFFIREFPEITHFVFNNLDPGKADGYLKSRAGENPWIIAKLSDLEMGLWQAVRLLRRNLKNFRIERIPLCYMDGFEEFSSETRRIVKNEKYVCSFIRRDGAKSPRKIVPPNVRKHFECCQVCRLNGVCAGVQNEYVEIYGKNELFPVFRNPNAIIRKISKGSFRSNAQYKWTTSSVDLNYDDIIKEKLSIEIHNYCNNIGCKFCKDFVSEYKEKEVPHLDQNKEYLKKNAHLKQVCFEGGEPTMSPNLIPLARYAKQIGYESLQICTNGINLADSEFCEEILRSGINFLIISLHAHNAKLSSKIAHSEHNYLNVIKALNNLSVFKEKYNFQFFINYVLIRDNYKYMRDFLHSVRQFKMDAIYFIAPHFGGWAPEDVRKMAVSYKEIVNEYEKVRKDCLIAKKILNTKLENVPYCVYPEKKAFGAVHKYESGKKVIDYHTERNIKLDECRKCRISPICGGIDRMYIAYFGKKEFKPIENE